MAFPIYSAIATPVYNNILTSGQGNNMLSPNPSADASSLVPWIRVISGTGDGLIMSSNQLRGFGAITSTSVYDKQSKGFTHHPSEYGSSVISGMIGYDWKAKPIYPYSTPVAGDLVLRPSPMITGFEVKEGKDQISRHATLMIKCFSLAQCEIIQNYCMEPGHSLLIEYGWNTDRAVAQLVDTSSPNEIIEDAAEGNLNQDILHAKRVLSQGDYDSFFGFIVGGNTASDNDAFTITVRLRGMPGLPTFLQTHHTINQVNIQYDKAGKVIGKGTDVIPAAKPYSTPEISKTSGAPNVDMLLSERRYKLMFNKLPPIRQTPQVQSIVDKIYSKITAYGWWDLLNFDLPVTDSITNWQTAISNNIVISSLQKKLGLVKEIIVGGVAVPRENLVSENRYINFGLALEILNSNNGLRGYKVGNKTVNVKISTRGFIGAFPGIFSTKPSKLIIPGKIPNFYEFYLNPSNVDVNKILTAPFIDNSILGKAVGTDSSGKATQVSRNYAFVQDVDLEPPLVDPKNPKRGRRSGYYEKGGYYGRLDYLYINFDLFYNTIKNSPNKSIRDVLMSMLNEMSAAANSFWNFQIVEGVLPNGDIELKIIDENWAGKNTITPKLFDHSGEQSIFLESNLDIDIPSEMANKIILAREDYTSNPDSKPFKIGGIFSENNDRFFKGIDYEGKAAKIRQSTPGVPPTKDPFKLAGLSVAQLESRLQTISKGLKVQPPKKKSFWTRAFTAIADANAKTYTVTYVNAAGEEVMTETTAIVPGKSGGVKVNVGADTRSGAEWNAIKAAIESAKQEQIKIANSNITSNLAKIDVIPNPSISIINTGALDPAMGFTQFNKNFKIYCCDDTQLFDIMQNNAYEKYIDAEKTGILLPIKYTFKILGKSGLRRGDVFNIMGIPKKYRENGFFQIVEIEQNLEGMNWTTTVTGQYRQTG